MRGHVCSVCLLVLLASACAPQVNVDRERTQLLEADRAWSRTPPDVDRYMVFVAPDASLLPPGMPIVSGHDEIRRMMTEMMAAPGFAVRWDPTRAEVGAAGDIGYTLGTYEITVDDPAGTPVTENGKYLVAWRKQSGGEWKAVAESFNGDAPASPPPLAPR